MRLLRLSADGDLCKTSSDALFRMHAPGRTRRQTPGLRDNSAQHFRMGMKPNGHCEFSADRRHRFELWRNWTDGSDGTLAFTDVINRGFVQWVGLNPSTADERRDDPTIRKCIGFTKQWGFGAMCMTNLYAWRDTLPANLWKARAAGQDIIGKLNVVKLCGIAEDAARVVVAWGNHGKDGRHGWGVLNALEQNAPGRVYALGVTKEGEPQHPLYLPYSTAPFAWGAPRSADVAAFKESLARA